MTLTEDVAGSQSAGDMELIVAPATGVYPLKTCRAADGSEKAAGRCPAAAWGEAALMRGRA